MWIVNLTIFVLALPRLIFERHELVMRSISLHSFFYAFRLVLVCKIFMIKEELLEMGYP
jgi:hypothetical protein